LSAVPPDEQILLSLSSEVAVVCDARGVIRWADERSQRVLAAVSGMTLQSLIAFGDTDKADRFLTAASAGPTEIWELLMSVDSRPVLVAWRGAPHAEGLVLVGNLIPQRYAALQDEIANVMNDLAVQQRETERQRRRLELAHAHNQALLRAEQAARQDAEVERARLQQVVDQLPEGIVIVDVNGVYAVANAAATEMLGVELRGQPVPDGEEVAYGMRTLSGTPLPAHQTPLLRSARRGERIRGEQVVIQHARTGQDVPLLINSAPLHGADGQRTGAVVVFQDIATIKNLEREKDEFLAEVSHDLKNPLAGIKGWTQVLLRRSRRDLPDAVRDQWQRDLTTIEVAAGRLAAIIDELSDLTLLQTGRQLALHPEPVDLVDLVRRIIAEQEDAAQTHQVILTSDSPTIEGVWDPARLGRVMSNLLANALKYSPDGGEVRVSLERIASAAADGSPVVRLTVADQGIGIPPEDLPHIFDRFYRATNATGHFTGTGIGLASARQLIEQHGGSIEVFSQLGVGSTFVVSLPLPPPQKQKSS
jgi:PAS domain S-box-containing protein